MLSVIKKRAKRTLLQWIEKLQSDTDFEAEIFLNNHIEVTFKRGVKGTFIKLSKKWMQSYVNEFTFRQNNKEKVLFKELIGRV